MKRITRPAVFVILTICLYSFLFFCNRTAHEWSSASSQIIVAKEKKAYTYQAEKTELRSFKNINADLKEMDFTIKPSNDNKCYISYKIYCYNSQNPFIYQVKDNTLQLDGTKINTALYTHKKGKNTYKKTISKATLLVPSNTFEKLVLKASDGNISVKKISCKNADLKTVYGDISLSDAIVDDRLNIHAYDGNVAFSDTYIRNTLQVETNAGDVAAESLTAPGTVSIKTKDGNMALSGSRVSGRVKFDSIYGDVSTKKLDIRGSLYVDVQDGNINMSDLSVLGITECKSLYGDIKMKKLDISGGLTVNANDGDIHMLDAFVSGKTKIRGKYSNASLQLKNACLNRLGIQAKTIDGKLSVSKSFGGSKSRIGGDGWAYQKPAGGSAQLDIIVKEGDLSLKNAS